MITRISAYIMPLVILIIVGYGLYKKVIIMITLSKVLQTV